MLTLYTFIVLSCAGGDGLICTPTLQRADLMVTECAAMVNTVKRARLQRIECRVQHNS